VCLDHPTSIIARKESTYRTINSFLSFLTIHTVCWKVYVDMKNGEVVFKEMKMRMMYRDSRVYITN